MEKEIDRELETRWIGEYLYTSKNLDLKHRKKNKVMEIEDGEIRRIDEYSFNLGKEAMLDKACKWLKFNTDWDMEWDEMGRKPNYGMIEEFRKAMEE